MPDDNRHLFLPGVRTLYRAYRNMVNGINIFKGGFLLYDPFYHEYTAESQERVPYHYPRPPFYFPRPFPYYPRPYPYIPRPYIPFYPWY
ncbi:spore coat protein [Bacillus amyloliquefaciens]|nr:spore coat protein [Bacillus amyloliquefaciens]